MQDHRRTQDAIEIGDAPGDRQTRICGARAQTPAPGVGDDELLQLGLEQASDTRGHEQRIHGRIDRAGHDRSVDDE